MIGYSPDKNQSRIKRKKSPPRWSRGAHGKWDRNSTCLDRKKKKFSPRTYLSQMEWLIGKGWSFPILSGTNPLASTGSNKTRWNTAAKRPGPPRTRSVCYADTSCPRATQRNLQGIPKEFPRNSPKEPHKETPSRPTDSAELPRPNRPGKKSLTLQKVLWQKT